MSKYTPLPNASTYDGWRNVVGMPQSYFQDQIDRTVAAQRQAARTYNVLVARDIVYTTACKPEATTVAYKLRKQGKRNVSVKVASL